MKRIGLLPRILLAIILGLILGNFMPEWFVRTFATFNGIFNNYLSFVIPFIIIGFIVPGIAHMGRNAGKMLGLSTALAYVSTIFAGLLAFFVGSWLIPIMTKGQSFQTTDNPEEFLQSGFFEVAMPPLMEVTTALIFAFVIGIGIASIKGNVLQDAFDEFQKIVEKVITVTIIPLLPFHIFGVFQNLTYGGQVVNILSIFLKVFVLIIALHITILLIQYTTAGTLHKQNPFKLLKTVLPAYFTAIGTQSSSATIPVTLASVKKTTIRERVADFCVPLFATIHLSGSAITLVTCSLGVLLLSGGDISFSAYLPFILMLGVTLVAAPGVPGGAVMAAIGIMEVMLGFNETMLSLMIALYLAQDSFGTATNVTGDGALSLIVDKFTKKDKNDEGDETDKNAQLV
jgi:Na+/H+-dicarboxylate symporter